MSILKANHNQPLVAHFNGFVVSNIVNVHFESKPQLYIYLNASIMLCQISLMSILKANHNDVTPISGHWTLCQISLMSILKANHNCSSKLMMVLTVVSNIVNVHFESKPQQVITVANNARWLCQISLMSILKANHNARVMFSRRCIVVSNIVNVHFESKPQPWLATK